MWKNVKTNPPGKAWITAVITGGTYSLTAATYPNDYPIAAGTVADWNPNENRWQCADGGSGHDEWYIYKPEWYFDVQDLPAPPQE